MTYSTRTFFGFAVFAAVVAAVLVAGLESAVLAEEETSEAISESLKRVEILRKEGRALEKSGDLQGALKKYEQALKVYDAVRAKGGIDPTTLTSLRARRAGETAATRASISAALGWLAKHQDEDGRWDCDNFSKHDPAGDKCGGPGGALYDIGVTGLSLSVFLNAGYTDRGSEKSNPYAKTVRSALRFLIASQDEQGCVGARVSQHFMYNHVIATAALCDAYGLTKNPRYMGPALKATKWILNARNPYMAWRYGPRGGENDTSVTGWCVYALQRAERAKLKIGAKDFGEAFIGARQWIDKMTDANFGRTGYSSSGGLPARPEGLQDRFPPVRSASMTASGLTVRLSTDAAARDSAVVHKGLRLLAKLRPQWRENTGDTDFYYWFWGTRACYQAGGEAWKTWWTATKNAVVSHQHKTGSGAKAGSWDPVGPWQSDGGRVYSTAILALTLQTCREPLKRLEGSSEAADQKTDQNADQKTEQKTERK